VLGCPCGGVAVAVAVAVAELLVDDGGEGEGGLEVLESVGLLGEERRPPAEEGDVVSSWSCFTISSSSASSGVAICNDLSLVNF